MRNLPQVPNQFFKDYLGFDSIVKAILNDQPLNGGNYPPYNIVQTNDNTYTISVAVAGHKPDKIVVEVNVDGELEIYNLKEPGTSLEESKEPKYIHRGISHRDFCLKFVLDKHMKVDSAEYENGVLSVNLAKEIPETYTNRIKITQK